MDGKIGGRIDDEEEVSSYWMILKKEGILQIQRESNKSQYLENSIRKKL
jgi:hypothetical protein